MKKFTLSLLCTLCISGNLFAAASDSPKAIATKLSKEMIKGKPLSPEMQKQLTIISFTYPDAVKTPLVKIKFTGSDQESAQAKKALNIIKRSELFQTKQSVCGMTIGWYLLFQNGQLTSIPLITKVKKGPLPRKPIFYLVMSSKAVQVSTSWEKIHVISLHNFSPSGPNQFLCLSTSNALAAKNLAIQIESSSKNNSRSTPKIRRPSKRVDYNSLIMILLNSFRA